MVGPPPAEYIVIGLGSLARGEATPFSDLEFAYIVETHPESDYFLRLAMQTYFTINNLGETPLKELYISELCENGKRWFRDEELGMSGLKIDGVTPSAGNIPTGNGLSSHSLTLTIDELMERYKESLEGPSGGETVGNLSYFFASTVVLYSSSELSTLYRALRVRLLLYEFSVRLHPTVVTNRLQILTTDLCSFNFIPKFDLAIDMGQTFRVKVDIFRYPTLLAQNLNVVLQLHQNSPWEAFREMRRLDMIDDGIHKYLQFILAAAIAIRSTAYLSSGSQRELVSLLTPSTKDPDDRFYVCRKLFIVMGNVLVPLKKSVERQVEILSSKPLEHSAMLFETLHDSLQLMELDKDDVISQTEVRHYAGDMEGGLQYLYSTVGPTIINSYSSSVQFVRQRYCEDGLIDSPERTFTQMIAAFFMHTENHILAYDYLKHIQFYTVGWNQKIVIEVYLSRCAHEVGDILGSKTHLHSVLNVFRTQLCLDANQSISKRLMSDNLPPEIKQLREDLLLTLSVTQIELGWLQTEGRNKDDEELFLEAIRIHDWLRTRGVDVSLIEVKPYRYLGDFYLFNSEYKKAEKFLNRALAMYHLQYGLHANHQAIGCRLDNLGQVMKDIGQYDRGEIYFLNALEMLEAIAAGNPSQDIAVSLANLAALYKEAGKYPQALERIEQSIVMRKSVLGEDSTHPKLGTSYLLKGEIEVSLGLYHEASESFRESLRYSADNAPEIYRLLAVSLLKQGRLLEAYQHIEASLALKVVSPYGHYTQAQILERLGQLTEAIKAAHLTVQFVGLLEEGRRNVAADSLYHDAQALRQRLLSKLVSGLPTL